ncbi:hypothetical protein H0E87_003234 [Populus deltoides]|uniref:Uncharacterized protein n=1 Tax=Populus deltoides TaxID=3696 RepID=A0A8T2ZY99_POPDE|nr:hypothetical protein H0E87_003234 [Populus deltoides]
MSTEVMFLRSHCYHVPERTSPLLSPCTYSVYANIRSDHPVRLMRRRLAAPKLLMLPQVQRPNRKPSPLTTITAAAAGVPLPPLDLTEENVKQVLVDARAEASILGQIFDTSVGITGQVELAELDGPFVVISLKGRFWHERSMVVARIGNYLKQRIPEILEVEIEDEKQLDDSPENF